MDKELIILQNISKKYEGKIILENIDISICYNQSLVIIGANGSGKSSLLRIIAGLIFIDSGTRTVLEKSLKISYVPEHFPKLSFYPLEYFGKNNKIIINPSQRDQVWLFIIWTNVGGFIMFFLLMLEGHLINTILMFLIDTLSVTAAYYLSERLLNQSQGVNHKY